MELKMLEELQKTVDWIKEQKFGKAHDFLDDATEQFGHYKRFVENVTGKTVVVTNWVVTLK